MLLAFEHSLFNLVAAALCFGIGWGMFDANNMPILCQFVSSKRRATAYGIMNIVGVFFGAHISDFLGISTDAGHFGRDFALLAAMVVIVLVFRFSFLKPKVNNFVD